MYCTAVVSVTYPPSSRCSDCVEWMCCKIVHRVKIHEIVNCVDSVSIRCACDVNVFNLLFFCVKFLFLVM